MIVFDLLCGDGHRFEGWFGSADDFTAQKARSQLACPSCGSSRIERVPSASRFNLGAPEPKAPAAPPGTFDAVRDGLVDVSYVTASYTPARHIMPLMAELPGAGATAEIHSVAVSRMHWKHVHKRGE